MVLTILKWFSVPAFIIASVFAGFYGYLASFDGHRADNLGIFEKKISPPLVIAHRGGAGNAPENTLAAFRRSSELGVDILELDLRVTSDGKLIVIHDSSVNRTTNGLGKVAEMTFEEIKKLDAGYRWTRDKGKSFPFRGRNVSVPSLREVLESFPETKLNIEIKYEKPPPVETLCDLIKEFRAGDRVIVASTMHDVLDEFRLGCKGIATSASPSESTTFLAMYKIGLGENYAANMQALQIPRNLFGLDVVTKEFVSATHERNLQVHIWTINNKEEMKQLIETGVDGIMTDYPDRLLDLMKPELP